MIVRPAGIDAGRFLAYRSTDQVFGLSHPRSGSFAHEWRVTLQTRLLSLPFATAPAGGCPEATTTRRRPYAQASHPEEGGRVSIQGLAGKSIWTSIGQRGTYRKLEAKSLGVMQKFRGGEESLALCGDRTDCSLHKNNTSCKASCQASFNPN